MAKCTKLPPNAYDYFTWDSGVIVDDDGFDPETGVITKEKITWATTGTNSFKVTQEFYDMGSDTNCAPEGTMQLQKPKPAQVHITGSAKSINPDNLKGLMGMADVDPNNEEHFIPRNTLKMSDFLGKWLIINYSKDNTEATGGYLAFHIKNAMNVGGFTGNFDKEKDGAFPYDLQAFYDMDNIDDVPYEVYMHKGGDPLGALTVTSVAGTESGDTKITVTPAKSAGDSYKYKVGTAATAVTYGMDVSTWDTWDGSADITAESGKVITVVEADSENKAVKAGSATVVAKGSI